MQTSKKIMSGALGMAAAAAFTAAGGGGADAARQGVPGGTAPAARSHVAATNDAPQPADHGAIPSTVPAPAAPDPVAHIAIVVDPLVASRIRAELDQVEQGLHLVHDAQPRKREALEVIRELRRELDKDQPNQLKVRGLLGGLAQEVPLPEGCRGAGRFLPQLIPVV